MDREILFRGRDIAGNWHYGVPLIFTEDYVCITAPHTYNKAVIPETVGQYTGLTDANGGRIFDGDIVKCRHEWRANYKGIGEQYDTEMSFKEFSSKAAYGKTVKDGYWGNQYFYYRNYVVEYNKRDGGWRLRNSNIIHNIGNNTLYNRCAEIIGNIHDNPELLTKADD